MKKGDKVKYLGAVDKQVLLELGEDPRPVLISNSNYEIEKVEVYPPSTLVWLKKFGGPYSLVFFEEA